jgi:PKD repeat protein
MFAVVRLVATVAGAGALLVQPGLAQPALAEGILCSTGQGRTTTVTGQGVRFFNTGANSGLQQFTGRLDFGDGSSAQVSGARYSVTHAFDKPGTYRVTIRGSGTMAVTYGDGSSGTEPCTSSGVQSVVTVYDLAAAFTSSVASDGFTVTFDASGSRDASIITGYQWNFGDGGTAIGRRTFHKFGAVGRQTVRLTVTSKYGSATASQAVNVSGPNVNAEDEKALDEAVAALPEDSPIRRARESGYSWTVILLALGLTVAALLAMAFAPDPANPLTYLPGGKALKIKLKLPMKPFAPQGGIHPRTGKPMPSKRAAAPGFSRVGGSGPPGGQSGPPKEQPPKKPVNADTDEARSAREKAAQTEQASKKGQEKLEKLERGGDFEADV